jgi:hypothetical protein
MRKKHEPETAEQHDVRLNEEARERNERAAAETRAMDAAVRQSIKLHGA